MGFIAEVTGILVYVLRQDRVFKQPFLYTYVLETLLTSCDPVDPIS